MRHIGVYLLLTLALQGVDILLQIFEGNFFFSNRRPKRPHFLRAFKKFPKIPDSLTSVTVRKSTIYEKWFLQLMGESPSNLEGQKMTHDLSKENAMSTTSRNSKRPW